MSTHRPMTDQEKQLFEAFKLAIEREREAQTEYGKMAVLADDPKIRGIFQAFEREEGKHERSLIRLYGEFKARFFAE